MYRASPTTIRIVGSPRTLVLSGRVQQLASFLARYSGVQQVAGDEVPLGHGGAQLLVLQG